MIGSIDLNWREDECGLSLHLRQAKSPLLWVVADATYAGMWRIRHPDDRLSDMVNQARAKDASLSVALGDSQSQKQLPRKPPGGPAGSFKWPAPLLSNGMAPLTRPKQKFVRSRTRLMASAPSTFRQRDVTRAVKAVTKAGVNIRRVEIDRAGKIAIITGSETSPQDETSNSLDQWLANHAHQAEGH